MRHALRSLFKSPGFTLVAILTIAVGISANTTLFSVFNTLVLNPIDLPDAGRLVRLWTNNKARNVVAPVISVPKYRMYAGQQTSFAGIAAVAGNSHILTREGADPEQLQGLNVTASFVPVTGVGLARGRNFTADEDRQNGPHVCIISYALWNTDFGRRPDIVGSTIQLDGVATTVVGILAENARVPFNQVQVFVPWPFNPRYLTEPQIEGGAGFIAGHRTPQARRDVRAGRRGGRAPSRTATRNSSRRGSTRTTKTSCARGSRNRSARCARRSSCSSRAVGFVLLIACANVSNLFLGRLAARHKEIAVRLSLGATRAVLVRQFLLEALAFCVLAGTLGVAFTILSLRGVERVLTNQLQLAQHFTLDAQTLAFTIGISVLASLLVGLVPALQASGANIADVIKESARGTSGGARGTRFRSVLIVSEVALSVMLLVGSSLLLVSFMKLQSTPAGFASRGVASAFVNLTGSGYPTQQQRADFFEHVADRLRADGRVQVAAVTGSPPVGGGFARAVYAVQGQPVPPLAERPIAFIDDVSGDYFRLLRVPLKAGRAFESTDLLNAPQVCIINESFARRLFPAGNAVGQFLLRGQQADLKLQIVGVVGDVKALGLNTPAPETIYQPFSQTAAAGQLIMARTGGDPGALQAVIRSAVAAVDKGQAVSFFSTLDSQLEQSLGVQRVTAWLTGAFAGIALLLSALGLYSVLAYAVTQRTGEIGIRMALGAQRGSVVGLVLSQGMRLVAIGLALGLAGAALGGRALQSLLYGVAALDAGVYAGVAVLFALVAAVACMVPSWRASRIDALVALRSD